MTISLCPTCRSAYMVDPPECEACVRRRRYGRIVSAIVGLDALDALADVMRDRHRMLKRHNKELLEESREAQRGARDAYAEGQYAERAEHEGGW